MASAFRGASGGFGNQLSDWMPTLKTADAGILPDLQMGSARADDLVKNHGYASGAVQLHVDNIVGSHFRLSYKPNWRSLGISEQDSRAMAADVESAWKEHAEDPVGCYLDAERKRTFTMMAREVVATHVNLGEAMASAEWISRSGSLFKTAIKMVSPKRVSNPLGVPDSERLRGGVEQDRYSSAIAYHVLNPRYGIGESLNGFNSGGWRRVPRETRWGRQQFIHIFEPREDGQTRAATQFMAVMEQLFMIDKLQMTKLQNAVVSAMYAAVIESELDSQTAHDMILGASTGGGNVQQGLTNMLAFSGQFHQGANVKMNGVKIPHLFPGESLNLKTPGNADNGFADLESAILRYTAAGMNMSYEQLARDYSKVNYSSARASMMESWRYFIGRRKVIPARFGASVFSLWFEEAIQRGYLTLPRKAKYNFYERKSAWCNTEWIGTGRLAIDGLKEVKEAVLRIESGLSTYEKELATMGEDYQEVFSQQVREAEERKTAGLPPPSWAQVTRFNETVEPEEQNPQTQGKAA
ncbi:phage portal protein [Alteromonas pelagimontana]|uniref:Phage portal protein n=2 Tax=Alteromonas pelagimontana TaxID=1858656 RepID=A0A6M4MHV0_9ALTE|nr:phage portal protein [Alteromonas pelagimontana]